MVRKSSMPGALARVQTVVRERMCRQGVWVVSVVWHISEVMGVEGEVAEGECERWVLRNGGITGKDGSITQGRR